LFKINFSIIEKFILNNVIIIHLKKNKFNNIRLIIKYKKKKLHNLLINNKWLLLKKKNYLLKKKYILLKNIIKFYIYFFAYKKIDNYKYNFFKKSNLLKKITKKNMKVKSEYFFFLDELDYYTKYSYKNRFNLKKCIIHLIEKRTNNFLNLRLFKSRRVIAHTSGGQGLSRTYNNSKKQKKGTRVLIKLLERKFRKKIKLFRLKNLYLISNKHWNFRIRFLCKR
jgi:hypothetical protein